MERLLRRPEVIAIVKLSRSSLYLMQSENRFPRPLRIGKRAVAWRSSDIEAWLASRSETTVQSRAITIVKQNDKGGSLE